MNSDHFKKVHFIWSVITAKTTLYMVVVHCVHVSVFVPLSGVQFCLCSQVTVMVLCIFSVHLFDYEVLNGATETDGLLGHSLAVSHFHNINVVFLIFRNHRHAPSTAAPYTQNTQEAPSQVAKKKTFYTHYKKCVLRWTPFLHPRLCPPSPHVCGWLQMIKFNGLCPGKHISSLPYNHFHIPLQKLTMALLRIRKYKNNGSLAMQLQINHSLVTSINNLQRSNLFK